MQRVSISDYLRAPRGRWTGSDGWIHFCTEEPCLSGTVVWRHVDGALLEVLLECAASATTALPATHPALVDARRVPSVEAAEFVTVATFIARYGTLLRERVSHLAGIRPPGFLGAFAEGLFRVVPPPYPVRLFVDRSSALGWLHRDEHADAIAEIEDLAGAVVSSSRVIGDLRRFIEQSVQCSRSEAARALGLSVRSLQRRLADEGTTFQREVAWARVRVAQRLMAESEASLAEVADVAGFSSPAAFSAIFRRLVGLTPKSWRDARRGESPRL